MILADTSAWVEYDRSTHSPTHLRLRDLLTTGEVAVTEPVVMEMVTGAHSELGEAALRRLFSTCSSLPFQTPGDFDAAAYIYRCCRRNGVTPRGILDCMIAAVALRTGSPLLTADQDLVLIAEVMGVPVDAA